jgi:ribonuclease Z
MAVKFADAQIDRYKMNFSVNILGCGSALPTVRHYLSSQVVGFQGRLYMIDCGEGTQLRFRAMKFNFQKLERIFISHLHGDHCFGLPGLISTFSLLGRTSDLHIHAHPDAEMLFRPILCHSCHELPYRVFFHAYDPSVSETLFEDNWIKVTSIPLKHRVPTAGFLFEKKETNRRINREMMEFYKIPIIAIKGIVGGADFETVEGELIPNSILTSPPRPARRYAYCSDSAFCEDVIPIIEGVDVLYHEATFAESDLHLARETFHSTASQAAQIALRSGVKRLIIGHFSARYPNEDMLLREAREIFPNTFLAAESKVFDIC